MQEWEWIRKLRTDLTDYVIHFTKRRMFPQAEWASAGTLMFKPIEVLLQILDDGFIQPTFAPMSNRQSRDLRPTIYGPYPAVCLTEQTLASVVKCSATKSRYSGFGIAYHKVVIHELGGRPVIYGTEDILGTKIKPGEEGFEEGKRIYRGALALRDQHLFARYEPGLPGSGEYPLDFMWEREWRINPPKGMLPVAFDHYFLSQKGIYTGAIIVETDADAEIVRAKLQEIQAAGKTWINSLGRLISLEEAKRKLSEGDENYGRIETWPDQDESAAPAGEAPAAETENQ